MLNLPLTNRGFTILEVLIVVVIIGTLLAIAIPNFQKYIEKQKSIEKTDQVYTQPEKADQIHSKENVYGDTDDNIYIESSKKDNNWCHKWYLF